MNGVLVAVLLIFGVALLAVGLVVVTLPLLSSITVPLFGLIVGGVCIVAGALTLWLARNEGNHELAAPSTSNRAFFVVLALFNVVVGALGVREGQWPSFFVAAGAGLIVVLLLNTLARRRAQK